MKWITDKSRIEQSNDMGDWYLLDNELYMDDDGAIYLVPRNYKTDNYTIPDWVAWVGGNKSTWDVRPSHLHDFGCQYHQLIKVNLNEYNLRRLRYLKIKGSKIICENIPTRFLSLIPIDKWEIDSMFKRMMKDTGVIPDKICNLFRFGVFFNFGWLRKHPTYNLENIYKREES